MYLKLQNFGVANRAEVIHMEISPDRIIRREKVFVQSYQEVQDLLNRLNTWYIPFATPVLNEEWWEETGENAGVDLLILHFEKDTIDKVFTPRPAIIVSNAVLYYMNDQGDTIDKTRI